MIGVVPAAGRGTRLGELTADQPKPLVSINEKPLLHYVFDSLVEAGITELIVIVGYRADAIIREFGDRYKNVSITYVYQHDQRGLGHAVAQASPHVAEPFVLLNGDNVLANGAEQPLTAFHQTDAQAIIATETTDLETAKTTGVITVDETASLSASVDRVTSIVEKPSDPPTTRTTTGCYVLPPAIFHALELIEPSDRDEYELADAIALLIDAGWTVGAVPLGAPRVNVNYPSDIDRAEDLVD